VTNPSNDTTNDTNINPEEGNRMTTTTTENQPTVVPATVAAATGQAPKIDPSINAKVNAIVNEMNSLLLERGDVIEGAWVGRVAQEHLLMVGPGGTAKSLLSRRMASHISDATYFETALDETTDPSQVFGAPDIKAMVKDGKVRRVTENMMPEASEVFLDEFFNANGPLLHSIMPALNERVFHNDVVTPIPLRQMIAGTNKLNTDADQAALWDRIHLRYIVGYIKDRANQAQMVGDAIARIAQSGRGVSTSLTGQSITQVTLADLDQAHKESLALDVPDPVIDAFFDLRDELQHGAAKVTISDRRAVEGMAAVLANAWVRGHETVTVGDLDILANMWWSLQDQMATVRGVILAATNPGEKAALDLLKGLEDLKKEIKQANDSDMDINRKKRVGVDAVKNTDRLLNEAQGHLDKATAAGTATAKLVEVIAKAEAFKVEVGMSIFNLDPASMQNLSNAGK